MKSDKTKHIRVIEALNEFELSSFDTERMVNKLEKRNEQLNDQFKRYDKMLEELNNNLIWLRDEFNKRMQAN